jgi:hypothetical protein
MALQFINTTTYLPVDKKIQALAASKLSSAFLDAALKAAHHPPRRLDYIDIFFVDEEELDRDRASVNEEDGIKTDLLGIYFHYHPEFRRFIIKVSPEKVMKACVSFKEGNPDSLAVMNLYPTLLISVIAHEVAHLIMDGRTGFHNDPVPWQWLAERVEGDPQYRFPHPRALPSRIVDPSSWRPVQHLVEESLANALVLQQQFDAAELDFLNRFMLSQPFGYSWGVLWDLPLDRLLETATTWKWVKREAADPQWDFIFGQGYSPAANLISCMRLGEKIGSVDFMQELFHHLLRKEKTSCNIHSPDWSYLFYKSGVLNMLTTFGERYGVRRKTRARLLRYRRKMARNELGNG